MDTNTIWRCFTDQALGPFHWQQVYQWLQEQTLPVTTTPPDRDHDDHRFVFERRVMTDTMINIIDAYAPCGDHKEYWQERLGEEVYWGEWTGPGPSLFGVANSLNGLCQSRNWFMGG